MCYSKQNPHFEDFGIRSILFFKVGGLSCSKVKRCKRLERETGLGSLTNRFEKKRVVFLVESPT